MKTGKPKIYLISKKHLPIILKKKSPKSKLMIEQREDLVLREVCNLAKVELRLIVKALAEYMEEINRKTVDQKLFEEVFNKPVAVSEFDPRMFSNKIIREEFKKQNLFLGDKDLIISYIKNLLYNKVDNLFTLGIEQMTLYKAKTLKLKFLELPLMYMDVVRQNQNLLKNLNSKKTQ